MESSFFAFVLFTSSTDNYEAIVTEKMLTLVLRSWLRDKFVEVRARNWWSVLLTVSMSFEEIRSLLLNFSLIWIAHGLLLSVWLVYQRLIQACVREPIAKMHPE